MSNSITNTNSTSRASSLIAEHRAAARSTQLTSTSSESNLASTPSGASHASSLFEQYRPAASSATNAPVNTGFNSAVNYEAAPPSYADHMAGQRQTSGSGVPDTNQNFISGGAHKPSMGVGSLRESAVGSGGGLLTGDYANVYDPNAYSLGGEDTSAGMHDYTSSRKDLGNGASAFSEAGTSYGAEVVWDENNFSASASAGAGAYTGVDWADEHGNYGNANAAAHTSVGAKSSNTLNEESGIRSITNGVGAGATASVGGYIGDEDGYTSANVAASVDMNAEATIHTTEGGVPVGMAANVGGDIGVEGEITQNRQTDKGFSETTISGGADIGMGAGAELGMNSEGNFVIGGDIDLGPIGGGVYMELDIDAYEEHGQLIDDKWHDGDYLGATAETADMLWDTTQTVPGLGVVTGIGEDLVNGLADGVNDFADGDILGGFESLGDGFLDAWENLPLAGDGLGALRDWVSGGGVDEALDAVADAREYINEGLESVGEYVSEGLVDVTDTAIDIISGNFEMAGDVAVAVSEAIIGEEATEAIVDVIDDAGEFIGDVVDDAEDFVGDVVDDAGDFVDDVGDFFGF